VDSRFTTARPCEQLLPSTGGATIHVLMLCTKYPLDPHDRYMTNELADALTAAGHQVQVVVTDWNAPAGAQTILTRSASGVDILAISPRQITGIGRFVARVSKWVFSSVFAKCEMRRAMGERTFDVLICFTPCVTVWAQVLWAMRRWPMRTVLFVHDFFPYHHQAIGLVSNGPVFAFGRWLEQALLRRFHVVGCNWPSNIAYLKRSYRVRPEQEVVWTPLWSEIVPAPPRSKLDIRTSYGLPQDKTIIVFGGQITEGRGIEDILGVAEIAQKRRPDLAFLFIGDGRLVSMIEQRIASGGDNVLLRRRIPRDEYLSVLRGCDVGLVATVKGVDSFSFPTKTIDYLRAALPIVAAVEDRSDYREFLERWKIGVSTPAGNVNALYGAIVRTVDAETVSGDFARTAADCLEQVFDVKKIRAFVTDAPARPRAAKQS
jgi:glycosyltransferase involved in cell wall biosynthesis